MVFRCLGFTASLLVLAAGAVQATPGTVMEELFRSSRTLGNRVVAYPAGTPEMRIFRITIPSGAKIPLHTHPSPVVVLVEQGALTNVRIVDGVEETSVVKAGDGFLEGHPGEPHYVINRGDEPVVSLVAFASVEGMPNLIRVE